MEAVRRLRDRSARFRLGWRPESKASEARSRKLSACSIALRAAGVDVGERVPEQAGVAGSASGRPREIASCRNNVHGLGVNPILAGFAPARAILQLLRVKNLLCGAVDRCSSRRSEVPLRDRIRDVEERYVHKAHQADEGWLTFIEPCQIGTDPDASQFIAGGSCSGAGPKAIEAVQMRRPTKDLLRPGEARRPIS